MPELHTTRTPARPGHRRALRRRPGRAAESLAALLGVADLSDWPPSSSAYDREAIEAFRAQLLADPGLVGWNSYYACWGDALVGCGGYFGPPAAGAVEIGYAIGRPWRRQGLASELVGALVAAGGVVRRRAGRRPHPAGQRGLDGGAGGQRVRRGAAGPARPPALRTAAHRRQAPFRRR